jgi:hypothetical protein
VERRGASNTWGCPISASPAEPACRPLNEPFQCFSTFEHTERGNAFPLGRSPLHRTSHANLLARDAVHVLSFQRAQSGAHEDFLWRVSALQPTENSDAEKHWYRGRCDSSGRSSLSWFATFTRLREINHVTCSAALTLSPRSCCAPSAANMSKNRPAWPQLD